jgi:hypothetical protein
LDEVDAWGLAQVHIVRPLRLLSPWRIEGSVSKPRINDEDEHPSAKQHGICGVVIQSGEIEWICVKSVHAAIYQGRSGKLIFSNNPSSDRHFFVNRYPNRKASA